MSPEHKYYSLAFHGALCGFFIWAAAQHLGLWELLPGLRHGSAWPGVFLMMGGAWVYRFRARRVLQVAAGALLGLWLLVLLTPFSGWLLRFTEVAMPPRPADAVVVLSSSIQPDDEWSDASLARTLRGLELMRAGRAPLLVLTEVASQPGRTARASRELMRSLRISVPVQLLGPVRDTHDEAVLVARLARQRGWKRVLLVTSPSHSRRAWRTFRAAGLNAVSVPAQETRYDFQKPLELGDRRKAFTTALHEIIGLQIYRRRGWA